VYKLTTYNKLNYGGIYTTIMQAMECPPLPLDSEYTTLKNKDMNVWTHFSV